MLHIKNKIIFIKSIIMLLLTYASLVWGHSNSKKILKIYTYILCICFLLPGFFCLSVINAQWHVRNTTVFRDLGLTPVPYGHKTRVMRHFDKKKISHISVTTKIVNSTMTHDSKKNTKGRENPR